MIELLDWVRVNFGVPGLVSVACVGGVAWMLVFFVKALRDMTMGSSASLEQISTILKAQEKAHEEMTRNQITHTEILRSLTLEVKSLADNGYRTQAEAMRDMTALIGQMAQRSGHGPTGP